MVKSNWRQTTMLMYDSYYSKLNHDKDNFLTKTNLPLNWLETTDHTNFIYSRADLKGLITADWFEPHFWGSQHKITGSSKGRFTTYFIDYTDVNGATKNMVLRHYYRGGLVRHISKDKFIFTGIERTRCYYELDMLAKMTALGLPVPIPVAARVQRHGFSLCSKDILIETIAGAKDGFHHLIDQPIAASTWFEIGKTIKRFHNENVFHSDLNIHNILIDNQQAVYLIDFDNCEFRPKDDKWPQQNLARLHRSLLKEQGLHEVFHFGDNDWQALLDGYAL